MTDDQYREAAEAMDATDADQARMLDLALRGDNGMRMILNARYYGKGRWAGKAIAD